MAENVDNVVSRAGVGRQQPPLFTETTFTDPRARANKVNNSERASDVICATFDVPDDGIWIERHGVTVRGSRPDWLDWPSHTAADMAPSAWPSAKAAERAVPRGARR
jgi:hypothetical protein